MSLKEKIASTAFASVVQAYREATGFKWFMAKKGEKTEHSCREFVRLQFLLASSTLALMKEAVGMYSPEWCLETFKTKRPPFYIVIGEKCRKRLIFNHRPRVAQSSDSLQLQGMDIARNLKNLMGYEGALALISDGWPVDARLRAAVFDAVKGMRNE